MSQAQKLEELLCKSVIPDIDERLDEIFAEIAENKDASDELKTEIDELREFKEDLNEVLEDLKSGEMEEDECKELIEDILDAQNSYEDEE